MKANQHTLRGAVEYHDRQLAKGWAIDTAAPERSVCVEVLESGRVIGESSAQLLRWDLMSRFQSSGNHGFIFRWPPEVLTNGGGRFEFRFRDSGQPLDGSPVVITPADDRLHIPCETSDLTGCRVLVLAPHPDDESFACGGSLILHAEHQDPVKVLFLTDGAHGDFEHEYSTNEYVALRRKEAAAAGGVLGVSDLDFWDVPDRELAASASALDNLCALLTEYRPGLVYAPSPLEFHPDYRAAAELIWKAVERTGIDLQVAFYEWNRPIHVNRLVDISAVNERKQRACGAYRSQLRYQPYTEMSTSLNRFRALTAPPAVKYAEGFFLMASRDMIGRPVDWFTVRQHLPMKAPRDSDQPLVSIIIRTKDRPALLREALSSVLTQTYSNIEVVVVDDGSEDVSSVVAEFETFFPLRLIRPPAPLGRAGAATLGAKQASGKYLGFLDDDDLLYSEHIAKLAGYLETTGERVAYSDCEKASYEWRDGRFQLVGDKTLFFGVDYDRDRLYLHNFIPFMTALVQRSLAEEIGFFDETLEYLEDWDFWIRASQVADFHRLPGVTALYRYFIERPHGSREDTVHQKHLDTWLELAKTSQPRLQALRKENARLAETLVSARGKLQGPRGTLSSRLMRTGAGHDASRQRPLSPVARQFASRLSYRIVEFQNQNMKLRNALMSTELEIKAIGMAWRLLRIVPEPVLRTAHRLYRWIERLRMGSHPTASTVSETDGGDDPFIIRSYREGDERQILKLFRVCFGVIPGRKHWVWKYLDHPLGARKIIVAFTTDGKLAAHYAGYPAQFYDATSAEPRLITALQIGDTMTSPAIRHIGRRQTNLLRRVTERYFAEYCEDEVGLIFGFNTGKIQRYYLRLIKNSRFLEEAPFMVLDLHGPNAEKLRDLLRTGSRYSVHQVRNVDEEWDALFERAAPDYGLLLHRNSSYLRWRYLGCPDTRYFLYAVYEEGRLVGWSVFRQQGNKIFWGDGLFEKAHGDVFGNVLAHAIQQRAHRNSRFVEGWFTTRPDWWADVIKKLGFERQPEPDRIGLVYRSFQESDPTELFRASLYYTKGDGDLF